MVIEVKSTLQLEESLCVNKISVVVLESGPESQPQPLQ